ncbi:dTDP-glucose 4,6-dehydratase [Maribacter hydrothermalis]|uniref:dTDP-glucose 4,6-dehydratase n=1 Tax=Maribacter hydrothermalis TaxID=1836467 RepID=A0A1B7ZE50_9FLAO|nr:dTDP-glucose 4,6-dehydratase [Maribacter hydrothermalis]APQ17346.1 dTDP-glucose 4,6-dehydratase [Maribacter hydrothermalis]OBR41824.1 dTDP-glucose 4,6-dehydratase [Maribacter hydrothermalis]
MLELPKENKTIVITGGAGFIGSNFIPFFLAKNPAINVLNIDKLTYAGSLDNLKEVQSNKRYAFIKGDICDFDLIKSVFEDFNITGVINFAAESHVDNSINSPHKFIKTNIEGTFNLLEVARHFWKGTNNRFHQISTDEVFGSLGDNGFFKEDSNYQPNSPYSASKASADFLVRSYHHTYGMNVVTSNCSNNYGPKQHDEKLIPTVIRTALGGKEIPIYGNGKNVRDWLYVIDHCKGIDTIYHRGKSGETYLLGGNNEIDNLSIAHKICNILDIKIPKENGSYNSQIKFVKDRLGHDYRYAVDATKASKNLNWTALEKFDIGLDKTIDWYLNKYHNI